MRRTLQRTRPRLTVLTLLAFSACSLRGASPSEIDRIADLLRLQPGHVLADVGAGEGEFAEALAKKLGGESHVYATEVKPDLVDSINQRMLDADLLQVTAILGDQDTTGLAPGCCDAILLRLVYHHFENPETMRADLWRALKPDGLIAIVDITPQKNWRELPRVPDRGGHGIPTSDLVAEMLGAGFELVTQEANWNGDEDRFAVLFRKPAEPASTDHGV